jgi:Zn-finger nucleic acid-binding protein
MKCPIDSADLVMAERHSIEIDYCPKCRGVWLDRGELDRIVERSTAVSQQAAPRPHDPRPDHEPEERHSPRYSEHDPRNKKRKSSFLGELFDFGD